VKTLPRYQLSTSLEGVQYDNQRSRVELRDHSSVAAKLSYSLTIVDADRLSTFEALLDTQEKDLFRRAVRDGNLVNGFKLLTSQLDALRSLLPNSSHYTGLHEAHARAVATVKTLVEL
jgi:hypothetical protein